MHIGTELYVQSNKSRLILRLLTGKIPARSERKWECTSMLYKLLLQMRGNSPGILFNALCCIWRGLKGTLFYSSHRRFCKTIRIAKQTAQHWWSVFSYPQNRLGLGLNGSLFWLNTINIVNFVLSLLLFGTVIRFYNPDWPYQIFHKFASKLLKKAEVDKGKTEHHCMLYQ